jgi:hypothetical protein
VVLHRGDVPPLPVEILGRLERDRFELRNTAVEGEAPAPLVGGGNNGAPPILRLSFGTSSSHEHLAPRRVDIHQIEPGVAKGQLANLVGVAGPARLDDRERPVPFALMGKVRYVQPRVRQRRHVADR